MRMTTFAAAAILAFTTGMTASAAPAIRPAVLPDVLPSEGLATDSSDIPVVAGDLPLSARDAPKLNARACAAEPGKDPLECDDVILSKREPQRVARPIGDAEGSSQGLGVCAVGFGGPCNGADDSGNIL